MPPDRLFDANAVVDVLLGESGAGVSPAVLLGEHILDLTLYEVGNALWKIGVAMDELADDDLETAVSLLASLPEDTTVETATTPGPMGVLETARDDGLTYYDAAYLAVADHHDLVLVTEDGALRDASQQHVTVESVADLAD